MDEIYDFLIDAGEKSNINWRESSFRACDATGRCIVMLTFWFLILTHRKGEKRENKNRMPYQKAKRMIEQRERERLNNFYFLGSYDNKKFDDQDAIEQLKEILHPDFELPDIESLPDNLEECLSKVIDTALALKGAFHSIAIRQEDPLGKMYPILSRLFEIYGYLGEQTIKFNNKMKEVERIGDQNSKNASTRTPARIEDYKKHERYHDLEQMIKSYRDTPKELRAINELLEEILETKNKKTIRRYRHLFFDKIKK